MIPHGLGSRFVAPTPTLLWVTEDQTSVHCAPLEVGFRVKKSLSVTLQTDRLRPVFSLSSLLLAFVPVRHTFSDCVHVPAKFPTNPNPWYI
jgi:hypothetical protein